MLVARRPLGTVAYLGGVPALYEEFSWAWSQIIQYNYEYLCSSNTRIHYDRSKVSYHVTARNELCQSMLGDWLLMLDTDHIPPPDIVARMLHIYYKYKLDVLVGLYQIKKWPYPPLLYMYNEELNSHELIAPVTLPDGLEIFKIDAAGGGCLLIKRQVIFDMITKLEEKPFDVILPFSEDLSFFRRLAKLGVSAYCCPAIENPHIYVGTITMENYDGYSLEKEVRKTIGLTLS
jgi:hypothetical protein